MGKSTSIKELLLVLGDIIALYVSLVATLLIRYNDDFSNQLLMNQTAPFTIIFVIWLVVFYVAGLYDLRRLRNSMEFVKMLGTCLIVDAFLAVLTFYLVPFFGIAPKTTLFIFIIVFAFIELIWRRTFNTLAGNAEAPNRLILIGMGMIADDIVSTIENNPQLGFAVVARVSEESAEAEPTAVEKTTLDMGANMIGVPHHLKRKGGFGSMLYRLFGKGVTVIDLANLYERLMQKIPLADLEETWFLENIENAARFYDPLKRACETVSALAIGIILLPVEALIAIAVRLTSPGPVLIRQTRVGENGKVFTLFKFRSMIAMAPDGQAEVNGPQWSGENDPRITPLGKFLRKSHLDELPQLWNVIRGDLSFVGPRPERPEIVEKLKEQIPYYEARLLVKPGVTGWAQINYRSDRTIDDVRQKLQYDVFYLKNRSVVLDLAVIVKTAKSMFVNPK
jgi:exopolysaccharide biosynthesis polyprenyl glycosylphosphotransferase